MGGPAMALALCGREPAAISRHWVGRRVSHAAHTSRHGSQSGAGLRALGPPRSSGDAEGSRTRWTPVTAVTSCLRRKVCTPSRAAGAGRGGRGTGATLYRLVGGDPQDTLWVPAGHDNVEEQGGTRALLPEDLPPVVGTPGPGEGKGQVRVDPAAGCVHRWWEGGHQAGSLENASHMTAYGGVQRGRMGASSGPPTNTVISPTSRSSSGGCRRWDAASNLDIPPEYVARAWFRYGAVFPGQRVPRACSRAVALLWSDMAGPAPVSRRMSPIDRGRPDQLDVRHSIQCP